MAIFGHHRRTPSGQHRWSPSGQNGQATILMAGIVAIGFALAVGLALLAQAMIHRAESRTAADAVALASVTDPTVATELSRWYADRGVGVEPGMGHALASTDVSQAAAWAGVEPDGVATMPALRAIVARIEQLRGQPFSTVRWHRTWLIIGPDEAPMLRSMQADFLLCSHAVGEGWRFEAC